MRKIIVVILILFSSKIFSQGRDVIKQLEECKNDSVKIVILNGIYDVVFELYVARIGPRSNPFANNRRTFLAAITVVPMQFINTTKHLRQLKKFDAADKTAKVLSA